MLTKPSKALIMGILNVTPDSFSDGGNYTEVKKAVEQAKKMLEEGADILDIGGESTRPGSDPVSKKEQIMRVIPVIKGIRKELSKTIPISIDTSLGEVAKAALIAGANIINDISAGQIEPSILKIASEYKVPIILMHMQGLPKTMQENPTYTAVVSEVLGFLKIRIEQALQAGIKKQNIIIDPGIGFGKKTMDNIQLLAHLDELVKLGYPVLLGSSRKRFMGSLCAVSAPTELVTATAVTTALGVMSGVSIFRVHDVKENRQAADLAWAIKYATNRELSSKHN